MIKYFLLSEDQVFGRNRLNIFHHDKPYLNAPRTDFATFKSTVADSNVDWWLQKDDNKILGSIVLNGYYRISEKSDKLKANPSIKVYGIRPAVNYSDIAPFSTVVEDLDQDTMIVEFGKYPQNYLNNDEQEMASILFDNNMLDKTKNKNVFKFSNEYILKDKKSGLWIGFSPIKWIVDKKSGVAVSKYIIDGGSKNYYEILEFLNNSFGKIIFPENQIQLHNAVENYNRLKIKKVEAESKLDSINKLMGNLENEIKILTRKKKNNEKN